MSKSLTEVKEVFKKYEVHEPTLNLQFVPRTTLPQALWELDINPMFTDLEALFKEITTASPPRRAQSSTHLGRSGSVRDMGTRSQSVTSEAFGHSGSGSYQNNSSIAKMARGEGKIDLEEFKTLYLMLYREYATNPQRVLTTFLQLDLNGDGTLTKEELAMALNDGRIDKLTDEEFQSFWDALDLDCSGEVFAAEFVVAMCPTIGVEELNEMLIAYGLEPNAHLYVKYRGKRAKKKVDTSEADRLAERRRLEEEETERLAKEEEEARRKEEEEEAERKRKEQEEADRRRKEEERRKREAEDREKREAEERERQRKAAEEKPREEPKKEEPKKEGGCCVVQ